MKKKYAVFFDLDRTIINTNSGEIFARQAYKRGLMHTRDFLHAIYLAVLYKLDLRDPMLIIDDMMSWMQGVSEESMIDFAQELVQNRLIKHIRPEIRAEIEYHKQQNADLVLLSAASNYVCQPFAEYLKLDHVISSLLEVVDGLFTGYSKGPLCYGEEKLTQFRQFCTQHEYDAQNAYYYADSMADFPVLNVVGHPICISPERALRRIARQRGWDIRG